MHKKRFFGWLLLLSLLLLYRNSYALDCEWVEDNEDIYCIQNDGEKVTGFVNIEREKYYFDEEGRLLHLKQKVGDKYYFFGRYINTI